MDTTEKSASGIEKSIRRKESIRDLASFGAALSYMAGGLGMAAWRVSGDDRGLAVFGAGLALGWSLREVSNRKSEGMGRLQALLRHREG